MARFWVSSPKSTTQQRELDSKIIEYDVGVHSLATLAILFWVVSFFMFFGAHMILLPMFLGALGWPAAVPEGYYRYRLKKDKLRIIETKPYNHNQPKPMRVEWYETLYEIDNLECHLADFIKTLTTDDFAFSHALGAYNTVRLELWDATTQWRKIKPFVDSPKASTKDILKEEFAEVKLRLEAVQLIVDQVFGLSLKSASFTRADKTHLDILVRELEGLCQSIEEIDKWSSNQLPAATVDLSYRQAYDSSMKEASTFKADV